MCCGTKRVVEIPCPSECAYLATAREHPAAAVVRRNERDVALLVQCVRDLNDRQSRIFVLVSRFLLRYEPPELQPLVDDDVAEAAAALAATFETAARGVIYAHRSASLSANRLAGALKQMLADEGKQTSSAFERDAAIVLRRIEAAARQARTAEPPNRRALVDILGRVIGPPENEAARVQPTRLDAPRLIVV